MKQEYIAQGKTIDEAIDEAAAQLGIDRDELSIEILETPSKGFLGFGSSPAKIKASYGTDELPAEQQAREYLRTVVRNYGPERRTDSDRRLREKHAH